jgi:hypothetical protein
VLDLDEEKARGWRLSGKLGAGVWKQGAQAADSNGEREEGP